MATKRIATQVMIRAVRAFNEGAPHFQQIMDDASKDLNDEQWAELEHLLEQARSTPLEPETLEQEQARLEASVTRLRVSLDDAERQLYAFYARKQATEKKAKATK